MRKLLKVENSINENSISAWCRALLVFSKVTTPHRVAADPLAGSESRIEGCLHLTAPSFLHGRGGRWGGKNMIEQWSGV
jgi:hypothetical protein